ncbi:hypothetical protein WJX74_008314 [Apatococcus lobatus]|uniref:Uncharacterized protein n=2 Tax=Apatococcus TaxID=904362 RepID=A0AAW1SJ80_9CHLO
MPDNILYSLVARGPVVLAEHSNVSGNAHLVAHRILEKLPQNHDSRVSYTQERHLFHVLISDGITFLCMTDEAFARRIVFAFLADVRERFFSQFGDSAQGAVAYEYNTDFSQVLHERGVYFSENPRADTINRVRGELAEVKNIMVENIEKVLDRGERIELLVDKTDHLQQESFVFRREARQLKNKLWWKNLRLWLVIAGVAVLLLYIAIAVVCGPTLHCSK